MLLVRGWKADDEVGDVDETLLNWLIGWRSQAELRESTVCQRPSRAVKAGFLETLGVNTVLSVHARSGLQRDNSMEVVVVRGGEDEQLC
jgi:hypothetical protein